MNEQLNGLVSVVIPMYNAEKYIVSTLNSIVNQTYRNIEIIIVNDYSNDKSVEKIKTIDDNRIRLINLPQNSGVSAARNKGIEVAQGKYIAFLDSDDTWEPSKLMEQLKFMEENSILCSATAYRMINEENRIIKSIVHVPHSIDYSGLIKTNKIGCSTVMINAKLAKTINFRNIRSEDYVYWLDILKKEKNIYGIDKILCNYRKSSTSLSANKLKSATWVWHIYRKVEKLSYFRSIFCFLNYVIYASSKHFFK